MKNTSSQQLNIADITESTALSSRSVIKRLKQEIKNLDSKHVMLDFSQVEFVSRSATHELLLMKEDLRQEDIEITFENTSEEVRDTLRIVAANRAVPKQSKEEKNKFTPERVEAESLFEIA